MSGQKRKAPLSRRVRSRSRGGAFVRRPSARGFFDAGATEGCVVRYTVPGSGLRAWHALALRPNGSPFWRKVSTGRPAGSVGCVARKRSRRRASVSRRGRK